MSSGETETQDQLAGEPPEQTADTPPEAKPQADQPETEAQDDGDEPRQLNLKVEIEDVGPCRKRVRVDIPREDIDQQFDDEFGELVDNALVPGFRPGHAPRRLIERKFRKQAADTVRRKLIIQSLEQIGTDHDIQAISEPKLDVEAIQLPDEGSLVYEFEVEVPPQFELPNYKGLKIKRPVKEFAEQDVHKQLERILQGHAQLVPKTGKVEPGDHVIVDASFRDGDQVLSQAGELTIRVQPVVRFQDGTIEKFDKVMVGAKVDDVRTAKVNVSPEAPNESLRGRTIEAQFIIKDLKRLRLPELNEEFLGQMGYGTEQELRDAVHSILRRRLEFEQRRSAREQLMAQLIQAAQIELPPDLVRRQVQSTLRRQIMDLREAGYTDEEIRRRQVELQQNSLTATRQYLCEHFLLNKIGEAEELEVTEEDIENQIELIALQNDESPRRVRARLKKEDTLDLLEVKLLEQMAVDRALEYAEFEDVPLEETEEAQEEAVDTATTPHEEPAEEEQSAPPNA